MTQAKADRDADAEVPLAALIEHSVCVSSETSLESVAEGFATHGPDFIAVVRDGEVLGVCSLGRVRELLSGRFGFALHARARVADHVLPESLTVATDAPLRQVLETALGRVGDAFYQGVALVNQSGQFVGMIPTRSLVDAQSRLMARQFALLETQRESLVRMNADLTAGLAHQRMLERRMVTEEKKNLVQTLAGGVAHEINNKLLPILGYAELIHEELPSDDRAHLREYCEAIRDGALDAARIIKQLLQLSRPAPAELAEADLRALLQEGLRLVTLRLREGDVALTVTLPDAVVPVLVDSTQIKQVLVNLVLNAVDAMETVTRRALAVRLMADGDRAVIEVEDSGLGIAEDHLARIFDPFFTTKAPDKGTGLGLSVCDAIVKQHGGEVTVRSMPGTGTTFVVSLPVTAAREQAPSPAVVPVHKGHRPTMSSVLVVDDDAPVAAFVRRALESHLSCEVEVVPDGAVAIDRLRQRSYSLVLSDVRMPLVNGVELFDWIAVHQPDRTARVAFMTGDAGDSELNARLSHLDAPVIRKPFTLQALVDHVGSLLRRLGPDALTRA